MSTSELKCLSPDQKNRPARVWIGVGAVLGLLGVVAGAAGIHVLKGSLDDGALGTFETAVRFQMYHAFALLFTGLLADRWRSRWTDAAGWLFVLGVLVFSGSLYGLALSGIGVLGAIAPLGGLSLILAWGALAVAALRRS
ncbi:MAG: DUF423 domain-containing protein [Chloroflexi bacterium]|nr:DUF423 domain-containing protein [Chloroflexota bacterium]